MNHEPTTSHNMIIVWLENLSSKVSLEKKGSIWVNYYIIPKPECFGKNFGVGDSIPLLFTIPIWGKIETPIFGSWSAVAR